MNIKGCKKEFENHRRQKITEQDLEDSIVIYEDYRKTMQQFTAIVGKYPKTLNAKTRHLIIKAAYFMDKSRYTAEVEDSWKH